MKNEVWKPYSEFSFVEASNLGRVRTLDRVVSNGSGMYVVKGRILKQWHNNGGYLLVSFRVNGKVVARLVHRIVAQTFIPNPNNLPEVNHRDNDRTDNNVDNLEWCTGEYNMAYKEKYGISAATAVGRPVYAVNLNTLEVSRFETQTEAEHSLGVFLQSINEVIKGQRRQAGGYWFTKDNGDNPKIDKDKLSKIKVITPFRGGIYAINMDTLEVFYFESQREAGHELGIAQSSISSVLAGRLKQAGGYWFTKSDDNAVESTRAKFGDIVADHVEELMNELQLA